MATAPNIATVAALIGDPARAAMLTALMGGQALTASELAGTAGISPQTASSHLHRLHDGGLLTLRIQGRHRYYALRNNAVAALLEGLMHYTHESSESRVTKTGSGRTISTGPRDPALRDARVCYDHLAGERGVRIYESLHHKNYLIEKDGAVFLSRSGEIFMTDFGIDLDALRQKRRPLCRACLDWSVRRSHLGGALGAALLAAMENQHWLRRARESRIVTFSPLGARKFDSYFRLES